MDFRLLTTLALLSACNNAADLTAEIATGTCENTAAGKSRGETDTASVSEDPTIWGEVVDGNILIHLDNMTANCCPTPNAVINTAGTEISIEFSDVSDESQSCNCVCTTDFTVTLGGATSGDWTIYVSYDDDSETETVNLTMP